LASRSHSHAALDTPEQPHPRRKHRATDLEAAIEAREHEAFGGEAGGLPGRRRRRDGTRGVVGAVAIGQMHDLLGHGRLLVERQRHRVGDDVVDEIGPHGPGIAQIVDLDRGRTSRQDGGAAILRIAVEVDRDIHVEIADVARGVRIGGAANHIEMVECLEQARPDVARIVLAKADAVDLETRPVVALDQLRNHVADRMLAEIRRHIGDAELVVTHRRLRTRRQRARLDGRGEILRPRMQHLRRGRHVQQHERRDRQAVVSDRPFDLAGKALHPFPVAYDKGHLGRAAERSGMIRGGRDRLLEARERLGGTAEGTQDLAALVERVGVARLDLDEPVQARERFGGLVEIAQRGAAVAQRCHVLRRDLEDVRIGGERLAEPALMLRRDPEIDQCIHMDGIAGNRLACCGKCLVASIQHGEDRDLVGERCTVAGLIPQRLVIARDRPVMAAEGAQRIAAMEERLGKIALQGERLVAARQRLLGPAEIEQGSGAIAQGIRIVEPQRQRFLVARQRLLGAAEGAQRVAAAAVGLRNIRPQRERALAVHQRGGGVAGLVEGNP